MSSDTALWPYIVLIRKFLEHSITGVQFQRQYFDLYQDDEWFITDQEFFVLDELFADADAFVSDLGIDEPDWEIEEPELRKRARKALDKLLDLDKSARLRRKSKFASGVDEIFDELLPGIQSALGDNLLGVYLRGSLATGDFQETSDIDFLVATERPVSDAEAEALIDMQATGSSARTSTGRR